MVPKTIIIKWDDIKLGFDASGHLPKTFFKPLLKQIQEAWRDEALYKKGVNSMIGCWFINENTRYCVETSNDDRRLIGFDGHEILKDAGCGYVEQHVSNPAMRAGF